MAIDQVLLLQASALYDSSMNREYATGHRFRPIPKKRVFICHAVEDFRLVEGFAVLMWRAGIDTYFDWNSGMELGLTHETSVRRVKERIALCNTFVILATGMSESDPLCMREIEYASAIHRRIYVAATRCGGTDYGSGFIGKYSELTIERSMQQAGPLLVKTLDTNRKHLWRTIPSVSQL